MSADIRGPDERRVVSRILVACVLFVRVVAAQDDQHDMSHMNMGDTNAAGGFLMNLASGTSMSPQSWPMPMQMVKADGWNLMFMGQAFLIDTQQTGPRGDDKFYSSS